MGTCESLLNDKRKKNSTKRLSNRGKQLYCAPVKDYQYNNNNNNNNSTNLGTTMNTDLKSLNEFNKIKPSPLYQYNGTYYKKGEQTSLMTVSLHEIQGNSFMNNQAKNSRTNQTKVTNSIYSCIDEKDNDSSNETVEIISDGKMNESMVQKSTDHTTIDSFNEFIGRKEKKVTKKNTIDVYYKKKSVNDNNNKNNDRIEKKEDNKDSESNISQIPLAKNNTLKFNENKEFSE
jgi:hypothetical protein